LANRELSISAKLTFGTGDISKKILKNLNFKEKYEEELSVFYNQINNYRKILYALFIPNFKYH
jgi:aspartate/tyrosine/aromatic aminotransferase